MFIYHFNEHYGKFYIDKVSVCLEIHYSEDWLHDGH